MPPLPASHLTVILRMACAQLQVPYTRKGFGELDEAIDDRYQPSDVSIDQRYIDERIYKPLLECIETGNTAVNLGLPKVHKLCNFIGFADYDDFCRVWQQIGRFLQLEAFANKEHRIFKIIHNQSEERDLRARTTGATYPGQIVNREPALLLNNPSNKQLTELLQKETGILVISDTLLSSNTASTLSDWLTQNSFSGRLCAVWDLELKAIKEAIPSLPEELIISGKHLPMAIQVLQYFIENAVEQGEQKDSKGTQNIHIQDSGAIFLGENTTVTGEYIASRDMNITIHNKK